MGKKNIRAAMDKLRELQNQIKRRHALVDCILLIVVLNSFKFVCKFICKIKKLKRLTIYELAINMAFKLYQTL